MNTFTELSIFPALLSQFEKELLNRLSTESGLSKSAVVRHLILKEVASRQLVLTKLGPELKA